MTAPSSSEEAASNVTLTSTTSTAAKKESEFVGVVLASTIGARLFPLTSTSLTPSVDIATASALIDDTSNTAQDAFTPKHLLPLGGTPIITRLLTTLYEHVHFSTLVLVLTHDDRHVTLSHLERTMELKLQERSETFTANPSSASPVDLYHVTALHKEDGVGSSRKTTQRGTPKQLVVVHLSHDDCTSPMQALRTVVTTISQTNTTTTTTNTNSTPPSPILHPQSHLCVLPGDLVILDPVSIIQVVETHRRAHHGIAGTSNKLDTNSTIPPACTLLLTDVGEVDDHGIPLKESAKAKKGGLAREEEDIEYIALSMAHAHQPVSSPHSNTLRDAFSPPRVLWKQSKLDVEQDEDMVGQTPKLWFPKARLRRGTQTTVRTDWQDVHVYVFAPWVWKYLLVLSNTSEGENTSNNPNDGTGAAVLNPKRTALVSIQGDLLPLLISRQFKGIVNTIFGSKKTDAQLVNAILQSVMPQPIDGRQTRLPGTSTSEAETTMSPASGASSLDQGESRNDEYSVLAHVGAATSVLRAQSIPSYLHASKEVVTAMVQGSSHNAAFANGPVLSVPKNATVNGKFNSVVLHDATTKTKLGEKVNFKSSIIGKHCVIGSKVRLNNVLLMDHVTIGDNTILQNSIVACHVTIGENCNLNDCQVGPGKELPAGTKEKGESFVS